MLLFTPLVCARAEGYVCSSCGQQTPAEHWCNTCGLCMGCCVCASPHPAPSGCVCPQCGHTVDCASICLSCDLCSNCCNCHQPVPSGNCTCARTGGAVDCALICPICGQCNDCCPGHETPHIVHEVPAASPLQAAIQASKNSASRGESITMAAAWDGGVPPYSVRLLFYDVSSGQGDGIWSDDISAPGRINWPTQSSAAGVFRCVLKVTDYANHSATAETGDIVIGGGDHSDPTLKPVNSPSPSQTPRPTNKPVGKLKVEYIRPTTVASDAASVILYETEVSGAIFPCTAVYQITDQVTGKQQTIQQDYITSNVFHLLVGPDISGTINVQVKVTDSTGGTGEKKSEPAAGSETPDEAVSADGKLRITGITPKAAGERTYYEVTIAGGAPPFSMSYDLKYAQAASPNTWSGDIAGERVFKLLVASAPLDRLEFKVQDCKGAKAAKAYQP